MMLRPPTSTPTDTLFLSTSLFRSPRLELAHPLEVGLLPVLRHEHGLAGLDRLDRRLRQGRGIGIPLVGQPGLQRHTGAVAMRHRVAMRLHLLQQAEGIEVGDHPLASLETVEAAIRLGHGVVEAGMRVEGVDNREALALADLEEIGRASCRARVWQYV